MMGGSSSGYIPKSADVDKLVRQVRQAQEDVAFEAEVSKYIADQLMKYNDRDVNAANEVIQQVLHELGKDVEGAIDLIFGGSVSKHTYVDGLSDIDALVLLSTEDAAGKTPAEVRATFADRLASRFGRTNVIEGVLSVIVMQKGQEVQLLPAVRSGDQFKIAGPSAKEWIYIRPKAFAEKLTEANKALDGRLVPAIKLAKVVIANLPEPRRLSGYHTEALAIEVFENYEGSRTAKSLLSHFFEQAGRHVRSPLKDVTGQSTHMDAYLGAEGSVQRRVVADALDRIARRMKNADGAKSITQWKEILEGPAEQ